jgi:hypothetical protein
VLWSFTIFDESHWYKGRDSQRWSVAIEAKIEFKLQVTATPAYHTLNDWVNQTIWLFSGAPIRPEDKILMELHGAEAFQVAVRSLTQGIRSDDDEAQKAAAEQIIRIAKPWTIRRWSESKLADGEPLVKMPKVNQHIVNLTWTTAEQQTLQQLVN